MSIIIVGSGLCGLWLAHELRDRGVREILLIEKARGVGGRMATRRTETSKFDHGAQFYSLRPEIERLNERWKNASLVKPWVAPLGQTRMVAPGGMTSLAKNLAADLDVRLSQKIVRIEFQTNLWSLVSESGSSFNAPVVIFTNPLPQALELLAGNQIQYPKELDDVRYGKALVLLVELKRPSRKMQELQGFISKPNDAIETIADQHAKGVSPTPALTVTMRSDFSEIYFDADETQTTSLILKRLFEFDPDIDVASSQLKKWRYSQPLSHAASGFAKIAPGLFLGGDAFGRPSLNGAVSSAQALAAVLLEKSFVIT